MIAPQACVAVEITGSGLLSRQLRVDYWYCHPGEAPPLGGLSCLSQQRKAFITVRATMLDLRDAVRHLRETEDEVVAGLLSDP